MARSFEANSGSGYDGEGYPHTDRSVPDAPRYPDILEPPEGAATEYTLAEGISAIVPDSNFASELGDSALGLALQRLADGTGATTMHASQDPGLGVSLHSQIGGGQ